MSRELLVRVADLRVGVADDVLITQGLGSCVAILLYDAEARIGGMAHVLLPSPALSRMDANPAKFPQSAIPHLMELIKVFRARVVDVAPESLILEVSGAVEKIDGLLEVLRPFGVLEMARSGRISMTRGGDLLRPPTASTDSVEAVEAKS